MRIVLIFAKHCGSPDFDGASREAMFPGRNSCGAGRRCQVVREPLLDGRSPPDLSLFSLRADMHQVQEPSQYDQPCVCPAHSFLISLALFELEECGLRG